MRVASLALLLGACASAPTPRPCPTVRAPEPASLAEIAARDLRSEWERLNVIVAELDHLYQSTLERARAPERYEALDHAARMAMFGALPLLESLGCGECAGDAPDVAPDLHAPGASASGVLHRLGAALELIAARHPAPSFACGAERAWAGVALGRFAAAAGAAEERRELVSEQLDALAGGTDERAARERIAALDALTERLPARDRARFDALRRASSARAARTEAAALVRWLESGGLATPDALRGAPDIASAWPGSAARILSDLERLEVPLDHESRADYEDALTRVSITARACATE